MALGVGALIAGATAIALLVLGGARVKKPRFPTRPTVTGETPPNGEPPTTTARTGETAEQGRDRLTDIILPWLNTDCLQHIMSFNGTNPEFIAREYITILGNEILARYDLHILNGMAVNTAVETMRLQSGELCGTFLPPGWEDIGQPA